jgi:hypothetical protein
MFRTDEDLVELTDQLVKLAYHWERVAKLLAGHPRFRRDLRRISYRKKRSTPNLLRQCLGQMGAAPTSNNAVPGDEAADDPAAKYFM